MREGILVCRIKPGLIWPRCPVCIQGVSHQVCMASRDLLGMTTSCP